MNRARRVIATGVGLALLWLLPVTGARAVPATEPDPTAMVNGPVRTIVQAGNVVWLGGSFIQAQDPGGASPLAVSGLVPVDDATGTINRSVHIPTLTATTGAAIVYDASLSSDGILYFVGSFSRVDGAVRKNVAAINAATGALLPFAPRTGPAKSVLATASGIYVGTSRLLSFQLDATPTPGYTAPLVSVDPKLRAHATEPVFRDIAPLDATTLIAACQCDSLTDSQGPTPVKAIVEIDARSGGLLDWAPGGLTAKSGAFGISLVVHVVAGSAHPWVFLAAGGSDFTAAYDAVAGGQRWKTDTSGSSQAVAWYEGQIAVGGHFDWTQRPAGHACGDNANPDVSCFHSPRLVAMDPVNGHVVTDGAGQPWNPGICCKYNGVWALAADTDGGSLHVGGEFTQMGGVWSGSGVQWTLTNHANQSNYGRLSDDGASPNKVLQVSPAGTGSGLVGSIPSGILCPNVCEASYTAGTKVTLVVSPAAGSTFAGWSGDCTGTGACKLTMDRNHQVTATFTLSPSRVRAG